MKRLTRLATLDDYKEYVEKMKLLNEPPLSEYKYLEEAPYQLTTSDRKEVANTLAYYENIQEKLDSPIDILLDALYYGVVTEYGVCYHDVTLIKEKGEYFLFVYDAHSGGYGSTKTLKFSDYGKTWDISRPKKPLKDGIFTCDLTKKPLSFGKVENEEKNN
jgi:hypothetical protein